MRDPSPAATKTRVAVEFPSAWMVLSRNPDGVEFVARSGTRRGAGWFLLGVPLMFPLFFLVVAGDFWFGFKCMPFGAPFALLGFILLQANKVRVERGLVVCNEPRFLRLKRHVFTAGEFQLRLTYEREEQDIWRWEIDFASRGERGAVEIGYEQEAGAGFGPSIEQARFACRELSRISGFECIVSSQQKERPQGD